MSRDLSFDRLAEYDFSYPESLTAQAPVEPRDAARLLIRQRDGSLDHSCYRDLASQLKPKTLLILNDTGVVPCRVFGRLPTGGRVELLFVDCWQLAHQSGETCALWAMARPLKKLISGLDLTLDGDLKATVDEKHRGLGEALVKIRFAASSAAVLDWLRSHGIVPLPPYIKRAEPVAARQSRDEASYQTVFAGELGSSAAPTAGLHMTPRVMKSLDDAGIEIAKVTLHVGLGTFAPVRSDDLAEHAMHEEIYRIPKESAVAIEEARKSGRPIVFVGTTSLRAVESWLLQAQTTDCNPLDLKDSWLQTKLFIRPKTKGERYRPQAGHGLLTNFHQPRSTLFMLVCGLIGLREAHATYEEAFARGYRLFSYGDASLLWFGD